MWKNVKNWKILRNYFIFYLNLLLILKIHIFYKIGISINTGEIIYESGFSIACNNCNDTNHSEYVEQDTLVVKRLQQTVRAAEVRTGNER